MTTNNGLGGLFTNGANASAANGANQLQKTAELTTLATTITNSVLETVSSEVEKYQPMVIESQKSHDAMDKLIWELFDMSTVDVSFLTTETEENLEKMLRSQQSKRSRSKSKTMTMDNYRSMMVGAVAENLLRVAAGKPKGATGTYSTDATLLTDEEITALANDSEKLKKAIRNVQSKKSIYKSKANFDENSERWQQLLIEEDKLKSIRGNSTTTTRTVTVVDPRAEEIKKALGDIDIEKMKAGDAKGLLAKITSMLSGNTAQPNAEQNDTGAEQ